MSKKTERIYWCYEIWVKREEKPRTVYVRSQGREIFLSDNFQEFIVHPLNNADEEH